MTPFLDPGSIAFDNPDKYGYRLKATTLEEHVKLVENSRTWIDMTNYEHLHMPSKILASAVYTSTTLLKVKGLISGGEGFGHEGVSPEELYRSKCLLKATSWKLKLKLMAALIKHVITRWWM